ncbi:hypothetical protein QNO07_10710 [Streptomyces sp. 549]|uniref:hypothetical protein n=1 Tax=Streptomyces sp. 549 TaxID=3049076 RepID=UPI0024C4545A|nr:hypothetical protein [Streptomyces sp. 549]MDK1473883.1 hypothetical protein [Streptomyces sp. 549]
MTAPQRTDQESCPTSFDPLRLDSAAQLMTRLTAQLSSQLSALRPPVRSAAPPRPAGATASVTATARPGLPAT